MAGTGLDGEGKARRRRPRLEIVVSIDGLQPEHDVRRAPATYDRIVKHIAPATGSRCTAR